MTDEEILIKAEEIKSRANIKKRIEQINYSDLSIRLKSKGWHTGEIALDKDVENKIKELLIANIKLA